MTYARKHLGNLGEQKVADHLRSLGFQILQQNYRKPYGEIDIIAQRGDDIAFVEVKTRRNELPWATNPVPPTKQRKIIRVAQEFIAEHRLTQATYRFDVAILIGTPDTLKCHYIENAFCDETE